MSRRSFLPSVSSGAVWRNSAAWLCLACGAGTTGLGVMWAQAPSQPQTSAASSAKVRVPQAGTEAIVGSTATDSDDSGQLRREGTHLRDERGRFQLNGTRVIFAPAEGNARYIGLENLNLQRISEIVGGDLDAAEWTVSGLVTEYQGTNYLLVTRATKSASGSGRRRGF